MLKIEAKTGNSEPITRGDTPRAILPKRREALPARIIGYVAPMTTLNARIYAETLHSTDFSTPVIMPPRPNEAQLSALPDLNSIIYRINEKNRNNDDKVRRYFLALAKKLYKTHMDSHLPLSQAESRYRNAKDAYNSCDPNDRAKREKLYKKLMEAEEEHSRWFKNHNATEERLMNLL